MSKRKRHQWKPQDIKGIFVTHSHPDHIGSISWFQNHTDCRIYASEGEKRWIENIDLQFKERPIPNFYALAGKSARVDIIVQDGDTITLEERLTLEIIRTAGHSADGVSYRIGDAMFIGDAVPVDDLLHCFNSDEYKAIMDKRIESVDARGLIIEA